MTVKEKEAELATVLLGESTIMRAVRSVVIRLAPTNVPVLISGPTGSGKELVAEALHRYSGRSGPFVPYQISASSDSMLEDDLFGHVKGAFTGAIAERPGYIAEAHRGTLYLDEIQTLGLGSQAKLLRVLDHKTYRQLGARADKRTEFRLVAATNRSLDEMIERGEFRDDLLYRLRGCEIELPALRARSRDISLLATIFVIRALGLAPDARPLCDESLALLQRHTWPGNVRELQNVIGRAVALSDGEMVDKAAIAQAIGRRRAGRQGSEQRSFAIERLVRTLASVDWSVPAVAKMFDVTPQAIYQSMQRHGIQIPNERYRRRRGNERPRPNTTGRDEGELNVGS